ncbi:MAG TPA: polysaccharide biosynthesis/export family protein, partial [Candidatus Acidoferrum sp.]
MMQRISSRTNLVSRRRLSLRSIGLILFLAAGFSVSAQVRPTQQNPREDTSTSDLRRLPRPSDLAAENYAHLAAAPSDVREVLVKDPGLLVELKRIAIKEATDNGQIVEDSMLTDDAIFSRLDRDVRFRSLATRLVQRYGYLLPSFNPDSEIGKERELVLKERARHQIQIEAQEDAEIDADAKRQANLQLSENCDDGQQEDCAEANPRRGKRGLNQLPSVQGQPSGQGLPSVPQQAPLNPGSPVLRTRGGTQDFGASGSQDSLTSSLPLSLTRSDRDALTQGVTDDDSSDNRSARIAQMMSNGQGAMPGVGDLGLPLSGVDTNSLGARLYPGGSSGRENPTQPGDQRSRWSRELRRNAPVELSSVSMIHRPNPYADIPSLYDMYVQASSRQRPLQRFGLDVFRNESSDLDDFPIDLPAGPDYMVGPGDGLAIDLWGGVSQRIARTVDRQGRISLPESGPVLVSGHTLAEVQETVQRVLRQNYRDVSADVSLLRLKTVRVYVVGEVAEPGAYDISSLSTPLNALFKAGGVTERGSLRNIKHFRGNKLIEDVDAYDLLLHGVRSEMAHLESGDSLLVAPVGPQVTVEGMVR